MVEFARRGFRLLLIHSEEKFRGECRAALRAQGLGSLLMGGQGTGGAKKWNLARKFYDLVVIFQPLEIALDSLVEHLTPQAVVLAHKDTTASGSTRFGIGKGAESALTFRLNPDG